MTNRNKLLFSDRCFWRHVAFSVRWMAQRGVVRNPTLTDLDAGRNPVIPPHQAPQQSPSQNHWSSETWATPSGMTMQRRGHATVSFLVASRIELKSPGRIWMFAASPGWTRKTTLYAWGEELPGEHGDRAGGAVCWDGVWVTLSSARFPGLEEEKKKPTPKLWSAWPDNTAVIKMHIYWNKDLLWRLSQSFTFVPWSKSAVSVQWIPFVIMQELGYFDFYWNRRTLSF